MAIRRVRVEDLADQGHGSVVLEGKSRDRLPSDRVYVNPNTGRVIDGSKAGRLSELRGGELELPRTIWYSPVDVNRLGRESVEMEKVFQGMFQLCEDTNEPRGSWSRFAWIGFDPRQRHQIIARYSKMHPYDRMNLAVIPDIDTAHKTSRGLCYMKDHEWNPDWTAATAVGTAIRFLTDYYNGRM